ncbi:MAG: acyltransferase [Planctomycetaceae bacterium]|nr:acyltransferase [Planctomycetaceae bacterium]
MMTFLHNFCHRYLPPVTAQAVRPGSHSVPLDGIRGLAVLLVLCYDCLKLAPSGNPLIFAARKFCSIGWTGVDLFFVLSGFLITGILLDTKGLPHYWRSFISRRSLRIFPLYFATLIGVFLIAPAICGAFFPQSDAMAALDSVSKDQGWYWIYGQNWLYAFRQSWPQERVLSHFWSLAIEEQFYLVWPFIVCVLCRRKLLWTCLTLSACALVWRICLLTEGVPGVVTYVSTFTRLDSLCAGAMMAILIREPGTVRRWGPWLPKLAGTCVVLLLGTDLLFPVLSSQSFSAYSVGHSLLAVTYAMVIGAAMVVPSQHLLARGFSAWPLLTLGKYSYAIYVVHRFVHSGVQRFDWTALPEPIQGGVIFAATVLGSLGVAMVSWYLLEQPFLKLKQFFPRPDEVPILEETPRATVAITRRTASF